MKNPILILMLLFSTLCFAQNNKEADALLDNFFRELPTKPKEALEYFFKTNTTFYGDNTENLTKFIDGFVKMAEKLGDYSSYEKLKSEALSKNVIRYRYVVYYRKMPLELDMTLYSFNGKWMCYNLSYYTDFGLPKAEKKDESK
jgi:hypothetical protein